MTKTAHHPAFTPSQLLLAGAHGLAWCVALSVAACASHPPRAEVGSVADNSALVAAPRAEPPPGTQAGDGLLGQLAPPFELPDQNGLPVALTHFGGQPVIVHFYPAIDTPPCACDATQFTDYLWHLGQADAVVLAITDQPPASLRKARDKYGLRAALLSDVDGRVRKQLGLPAAQATTRATLLIDDQGRVVGHWTDASSRAPVDGALADLDRARASK